jgi:hypothetical protein
MDTDPLLAIISRGDTDYDACVAAFQTQVDPLNNLLPLMTEATWLFGTISST